MASYRMLLHRTVLPQRDGAEQLRKLGAGIRGLSGQHTDRLWPNHLGRGTQSRVFPVLIKSRSSDLQTEPVATLLGR